MSSSKTRLPFLADESMTTEDRAWTREAVMRRRTPSTEETRGRRGTPVRISLLPSSSP